MGRTAAIAAALLALGLAAGCGRAGRSPTATAAPTVNATAGTATSEAERNAQRNLEGAEANAADQTQTRTATTQTAKPQTANPPAAARPTAARPAIIQRPIPFGAKRREEMRAYARRHYGIDDFHLRNPKVIVEHYTATDTFQAAYSTFANDVPDVELHELPGTCAHFIVDKDGTIYQLVALTTMCRHTVGLNWTAFGIEQVGLNAREILDRPAQYGAVVRLTAWLRCRYGIAVRNVIGHNESLSSPYHHENVAALRRQTHSDWTHAEMTPVRARLTRYRCPG
jgi:N-acetylmuramoyl-L-alanine amidase